MDMAVANLLKRKIRFTSLRVYTELYEPMYFRRTHYYRSPTIENVESLGLNDVNDLCTILCKPIVLYALSKVFHEDRVIPIDFITIMIGVFDFQKGEDYNLSRYRFENPLDYPELFYTHAQANYCSFPERLLNERTYIFVDVICDYMCSNLRQEARFREEFNYDRYWRHRISIEEVLARVSSDEEIYDSESTDEEITDEQFQEYKIIIVEEYTPPKETYRQDHCVVCLEAKPNILYLDCMHIAICDSCDRLKKTGRDNCDVCRAEISKRVKI